MLQLLEQVLLASTFNVQLVSADMTPEFSESNSESNIFSQRVTICTQIILSLLKTVNRFWFGKVKCHVHVVES